LHEVDEYDEVSGDNAGQVNHADHGGRREKD